MKEEQDVPDGHSRMLGMQGCVQRTLQKRAAALGSATNTMAVRTRASFIGEASRRTAVAATAP